MSAVTAPHHPPVVVDHLSIPPQLDEFMLFGFLSAFVVLVLFIYRHHSPAMMAALSICLLATAVYGFAAGAWPLGLVQFAFACSYLRKWLNGRRTDRPVRMVRIVRHEIYESESRISRMFGPT